MEDCACRGSLFLHYPWVPAHRKYLVWIGISTILLRCKACIEMSVFFCRYRVYFGHALKFHVGITSCHPQNRMFMRKPRILLTEKLYCEMEFAHLVSVVRNANSMRIVSIASHGFRVLNFEYLAELPSLATSATWIFLHFILKCQRLTSKVMPSICTLRFERLCCLL